MRVEKQFKIDLINANPLITCTIKVDQTEMCLKMCFFMWTARNGQPVMDHLFYDHLRSIFQFLTHFHILQEGY